MEVLTIGHSNVSAARFLDLLQQHGVTAVVDVRSVPYSRHNPQFNHEALRGTVEAAGITYVAMGVHLGGRPDDPACYEGGQVQWGRIAAQPWYQQAIDRLLGLAGRKRTAILCAEEDPQRCHRQHLVSQTLLQRGVTVWHIRGSGQVERARREEGKGRQLALFDLDPGEEQDGGCS